MKAVLISIQPKWCEFIASGKKTVEVRKTRPKLKLPFKCYIYQTKKVWTYDIYSRIANYQGRVIGEFVCDEITGGFWVTPFSDYLQSQSCLSYREVEDYGNDKPIFAWHISDLVIYEKPKELSEFYKVGYKDMLDMDFLTENSEEAKYWKIERPPQSWCFVEELVGDNNA